MRTLIGFGTQISGTLVDGSGFFVGGLDVVLSAGLLRAADGERVWLELSLTPGRLTLKKYRWGLQVLRDSELLADVDYMTSDYRLGTLGAPADVRVE